MSTDTRSRWDPADDPVARLFGRFGRLAVPLAVLGVVWGVLALLATVVAADSVAALVVGALLWGGGAVASMNQLVRRVRGLPHPLEGVDRLPREEARTRGVGKIWRQCRASAAYTAVVALGYGVLAGLDADRRDALTVAAVVLAATAALFVVLGIIARRTHRRRTTALADA